MSPGSTTRLKRQSSMPAKNGILPAFASSASTATAPACAIASIVSTPGITGRSGKWPGNHQSSARISRRPTTRLPGSSSRISSTSRNGGRCGISDSITSRPNGVGGRFMPPVLRDRSLRRARPRCAWHFAVPTGMPAAVGDLFERVAERVLQQHDLRLLRRDLAERLRTARAGARRCPRRAPGRRRTGRCSLERLVHARPPALDGVETRVDDEPVQPRRELRAAAELLQPDAHLRERLLRGVVARRRDRAGCGARAAPPSAGAGRGAPRAPARRRPSRA